MRHIAGVVLCALLVAAGCTDTTAVTSAEVPLVELPCPDSSATVPDEFLVVLDVVALPGGTADARPLQIRPDDAHAGFQFAKTGLLFRAGSAFTLRAGERNDNLDFRFGWGDAPIEPVTTISSGECDGQGWLGIPGGYWVSEAGCYEVVVTVEDRHAAIDIPIGTPCSEQQ